LSQIESAISKESANPNSRKLKKLERDLVKAKSKLERELSKSEQTDVVVLPNNEETVEVSGEAKPQKAEKFARHGWSLTDEPKSEETQNTQPEEVKPEPEEVKPEPEEVKPKSEETQNTETEKSVKTSKPKTGKSKNIQKSVGTKKSQN